MATFSFGAVVLVPFPFTDQSTAKQRPAVIVSSDAYHRARRDLILMPITSQLRGNTFGDVFFARLGACSAADALGGQTSVSHA